MKLQLNKFIDTILKLKNSATGDLIPATFANVQLQSSDEAVFTANSDVNADGEIDVVPVAVGEGTLTATADATYVDPGTGEEVTRSKTASITVTVTQPEAGTEMVVTFGDPQDMPA